MSICKKEDGETREWVPRKKKAGLGFPQVLTQIRGSFEILMKALGLYIKRGLEIYVLKQTKPKKKKIIVPKTRSQTRLSESVDPRFRTLDPIEWQRKE